jgi:hypothetical protein
VKNNLKTNNSLQIVVQAEALNLNNPRGSLFFAPCVADNKRRSKRKKRLARIHSWTYEQLQKHGKQCLCGKFVSSPPRLTRQQRCRTRKENLIDETKLFFLALHRCAHIGRPLSFGNGRGSLFLETLTRNKFM